MSAIEGKADVDQPLLTNLDFSSGCDDQLSCVRWQLTDSNHMRRQACCPRA